MNESDAKARSIADGDSVVVYNDRGEHACEAVVADGIMVGVVRLDNGHREQRGGSSRYVTNDAFGPIAGEHRCNETPVEVRKALVLRDGDRSRWAASRFLSCPPHVRSCMERARFCNQARPLCIHMPSGSCGLPARSTSMAPSQFARSTSDNA